MGLFTGYIVVTDLCTVDAGGVGRSFVHIVPEGLLSAVLGVGELVTQRHGHPGRLFCWVQWKRALQGAQWILRVSFDPYRPRCLVSGAVGQTLVARGRRGISNVSYVVQVDIST